MTATGTQVLLAHPQFEVDGPLPAGTTVLEASAGTGKTFTIAALATRYVAEGIAALPRLMLVTFGREATQELRERVRERLGATERGLAAGVPSADPVTRLLQQGSPEEVAERRARLRAALAEFDAATIATTHQFCQQMLAGLGVAGDSDPDAEFVEHVDDLVTEVVDDFYVRKYAAPGAGRPDFSRDEALKLARQAVGDPQARLEPADASAGSVAGVRYNFAKAVRGEVDRRKRARRLFSYDDMLTRLAGALRDPVRGAAARERLQARYDVVLVDEFQDTDPVQWEILQRAFHGHVTLVLIGDPKQAIYAFRGADVVSYLEAAKEAGELRTLGTNYRTDEALLEALDGVFGEVALGSDQIVVRGVEAHHTARRLASAPSDEPFRLRVVDRDRLEPLTGRRLGRAQKAREVVAEDVAADIAALLASPATVEDRPLRAGDVAVLVRTNAQGVQVRDACTAAGVPAVLTGTTSVFTTEAAAEWLTLLEAVEQPQRATRLRAAALTCFVGHTVEELCGERAEELIDELGTDLRAWHAVLAERGVAALLEAVTSRTRLPARLLGLREGDRRLTDVRHIGQVLHGASLERHLGPSALVEWLRHRMADAARDTTTERSRRLESDADAVQIVTVHRSKGLEFPVVYVPFGWDRWVNDKAEVLLVHDDTGARVLDVGGALGPHRAERLQRHLEEEAGEDLRLMYVALTRARCQVVAWWAPTTTTECSALHRLLIGRPAAGTVPEAGYRVPSDASALELLRSLPGVTVETLSDRTAAPAPDRDGDPPKLGVARFARRLDAAWRRTSYSALTADAHGHHASVETPEPPTPGVGSEPEAPGKDDEAELELLDVTSELGADLPSPMADLPLGTGFGTLVHAVFEHLDTTAADMAAELRARITEELARQPAEIDPEALAAGLRPVVETPLGPLAGGRALREIRPADRLAELDFEMPLAGGDTPSGQVTLGDLAPVLRRHLPAGDPLASYPDLIAAPGLAAQPLRGYLTGSIDAVLRVDGRFLVVDYKTNWLGPSGPGGREPLTAAHYAPPVLAAAMQAAHYPLQALLYSVALHRFLRWRLAGYSPERHLGGTLYLFLRGMCGPDTPQVDGTPCGVFGWQPPPALIAELSDVLDARSTRDHQPGPPAAAGGTEGSDMPITSADSGPTTPPAQDHRPGPLRAAGGAKTSEPAITPDAAPSPATPSVQDHRPGSLPAADGADGADGVERSDTAITPGTDSGPAAPPAHDHQPGPLPAESGGNASRTVIVGGDEERVELPLDLPEPTEAPHPRERTTRPRKAAHVEPDEPGLFDLGDLGGDR
ncbi:UvrD-helicase domain-containing protein [Pseudonocardia sp. NPDC049154]|uniref:UvrD-helicase domain-containing protein n=1 Tax=Pseudonocardia sp. NPDC049154 TaxID=3155501 RepID=UPI0033C5A555